MTDLKKLRMFHEVFVSGSVTKAAERCCVSQPAASKALNALEAEIGYPLFSREGGMLNPTDEAYHLFEEVETLLAGAERLKQSFRRVRHERPGKLNICTTLGPSYNIVPALIAEFLDRYPGLEASFNMLDCSAIREAVASGRYQIGLVDKAGPTSRYESRIFDLECALALPAGHPKADAEHLGPADLDNEGWIAFGPDNVVNQALEHAYERAGARFRQVMEVKTTLHALSFVNLGVGIALVDALNQAQLRDMLHPRNVRIVPFTPPITEPFEVITANVRPLSPVASEFHERLLARIEEILANSLIS